MKNALAQRLERLEAAMATRRRGVRLVRCVIDEDPEEALDRMIADGEITEAQRGQVLVIQRVVIEPAATPEEEPASPTVSPRIDHGMRTTMAERDTGFRRVLEYPPLGVA